ncbi:unnamed protein product [Paramecium sonneborni]|uniref:Uncharacterized protein n=1 Tax=Paramecium sonneborni TaxID=65129 RepID=A0A8S1M7T3_9CILI|nr:unnamed protein product [Paramecium sonneborni]
MFNYKEKKQSQSFDDEDIFSIKSTVSKLKQEQKQEKFQIQKACIKSYLNDEQKFDEQNQRVREQNWKINLYEIQQNFQDDVIFVKKIFESFQKEFKLQYYSNKKCNSRKQLCCIEFNQYIMNKLFHSLKKKSQIVFGIFRRDKSKDKWYILYQYLQQLIEMQMSIQRPHTSTTRDISTSVFGQSRIEWHSPNKDLDWNQEKYIKQENEIIIEQSESPIQQKQKQVTVQQYKLISFAELIQSFRLSEGQYSVRNKSKCSCYGFSSVISTTDQVKQKFIQIGMNQLELQNEFHRNTVYSIHYLLNNGEKPNENQLKMISKYVSKYFQLMQFLSCLEFETPQFQILYKESGELLIQLVMNVGQMVFEQLLSNKLNKLIQKEQSHLFHNILRNYQSSLIFHIYKEIKKQNLPLQILIKNYEKSDPNLYYYWYIQQKQYNNNLFSD